MMLSGQADSHVTESIAPAVDVAITMYGELSCRAICIKVENKLQHALSAREKILDYIIDGQIQDPVFLKCPAGVKFKGFRPRESWWNEAYLGKAFLAQLFRRWIDRGTFVIQAWEGIDSIKYGKEFLKTDHFNISKPLKEQQVNVVVHLPEICWNMNARREGGPGEGQCRFGEDVFETFKHLFKFKAGYKWEFPKARHGPKHVLVWGSTIRIIFDIPSCMPSSADVDALAALVKIIFPLLRLFFARSLNPLNHSHFKYNSALG